MLLQAKKTKTLTWLCGYALWLAKGPMLLQAKKTLIRLRGYALWLAKGPMQLQA